MGTRLIIWNNIHIIQDMIAGTATQTVCLVFEQACLGPDRAWPGLPGACPGLSGADPGVIRIRVGGSSSNIQGWSLIFCSVGAFKIHSQNQFLYVRDSIPATAGDDPPQTGCIPHSSHWIVEIIGCVGDLRVIFNFAKTIF